VTLAEAALTITLTWHTFKVAGIALFAISSLVLCFGDLPDHAGVPLANAARWVVWPLTAVWLVVLLVRALVV
jgi:hypothetical protein